MYFWWVIALSILFASIFLKWYIYFIDVPVYEETDIIHVVTTTSPNYKKLYNIFNSTLTKDPNITLHTFTIDLSKYDSFGFMSESWAIANYQKIVNTYNFMSENPQLEYFVFADADIQFFKPGLLKELVKEAKQKNLDFYGMPEGNLNNLFHVYNGGFYILRNNKNMREFMKQVFVTFLKDRPKMGDQDIINKFLGESYWYRHAKIEKYLIQGRRRPFSKDTLLHHATSSEGVESKYEQILMQRKKYNKMVEKMKTKQFTPFYNIH
jgi:Nucleotide-diphospho-sugar transferase